MFDRDEYNKQYYNNNKEKVLKAAKQWANNSKEYVKEYAKQWANNNKEKKAEHSKQWNNNNKEKKAEHNKLYYKNNKDKMLAALRKRYKATGCTLQLRIRVSHMYRQWRSDVFTRDDFTCQRCGRRGGELHAHHEEAFADIMEFNDIRTFEQAMDCSELWNINNGTTLCKRCHRKEVKNQNGVNQKVGSADKKRRTKVTLRQAHRRN